MIRLEHVALWSTDIERLKAFYQKYFDAQSGAMYVNEAKQFRSYFLSFATGARLEIMQRPGIIELPAVAVQQAYTGAGYVHIAFSTGSEEAVNALTARLQADGYTRLDGPRLTGDGYYESVVLDPDGNRIEITG
jgi:lactoylglutathione lyase